MTQSTLFDQDLLEKLKYITGEGVNNAARGFSRMIGRKIHVNSPSAQLVPILQIPEIAGKPDDDAVGIYLRFKGDADGQIMMIIPLCKALELVDLIMGVPQGTTQSFGSLERSALGELGNLCGSFFLNSIASITAAKFHPTPPAVMVDMVGAILDIVVATTGGICEQALLIKANFMDGERCVDADFWVIPDIHSLNEIIKKHTNP